MKAKNYLFIVFTSTLLLFNVCGRNDVTEGKITPLHFDKTEKTIDFEKQSIVFNESNQLNFFVSHIREIIGSDILRHHHIYYYKNEVIERKWEEIKNSDTLICYTFYPAKQEIEGQWYKVNVNENIITVDISENEGGEARELILNISAGGAGEELKILQN